MQFVLSAARHRAGIRVPVLASMAFFLVFSVSAHGRSRRTGSVAGRIVDAQTGEGIPAVVLSIEDVERVIVGDHDGRFRADGIPDGRRELLVEATGYAAESRRLDVPDGETLRVDIALKPLSRAAVAGCDTCRLSSIIVGRVLDTLGAPIKGASVTLGDGRAQETTGSDGTFSFPELAEGTYRLSIAREDYRGDTLGDLAVADGRAVVVAAVLRPSRGIDEVTGVVTGTVRSAADSAAVAGATVSLLNTDYTALTDSSGVFELRAIPPGTYSLLTTKWGFEAQVLSGVEIRAGAATRRDVVLSARAAGAFSADGGVGGITGIVSDEGGEAVGNALVFLRDKGQSVHSDYRGRFSFDSLASGVYSVAAAADGYDTSSTRDVDVWSGEMTTVNLTLRERVEISADSLVPGPDRGLFTGLVVDAEKGQPVAGAEVVVHGERGLKSVTDLNGRYVIRGMMPGTYTLEVSHAEYTTQVTSGVKAQAGRKTITDFVLSTSDVSQMARMSIRAVAIKNTGAALLKERQRAISFTDAVGAQEMSQAGASNAADAMKSVTGATVVGGKYVLIRGLPERYTVTTLNGSPLPSPDPTRKAVNMDLFPAGMIENITTSKTFTPDLPGNFAGGVVDIRTKPFPERLSLSVSLSQAANNQSTFDNRFLTYDGGSLDWLGFDDGTRARPEVIVELGDDGIEDLSRIANMNWESSGSYADYLIDRLGDEGDKLRDSVELLNEAVTSLDTCYEYTATTALPNTGLSFSLGNTLDIFNHPFGFRVGLTYSNKYSLSLDDVLRKYDNFSNWVDTGSHEVEPYDDYRVTRSSNAVSWGTLATGAYRLSDDHEVQINYMYSQNAKDEVTLVRGLFGYYNDADDNTSYNFHRLHFTERSLSYIQPNGRHRVWVGGLPLELVWHGSYTYSDQEEPDMRDYYDFSGPSGYTMQTNLGDASHRWRDLVERAGTAELRLALPFYQWSGDSATAIAGGSWFGKKRMVDEYTYQYDLMAYWQRLTNSSDIQPVETISAEHLGIIPSDTTRTGFAQGMFIQDMSSPLAQWEGTMHVLAAYGLVQLPLFRTVSSTIGLRYERADMLGGPITKDYGADTSNSVLDDHDLLPSVSLCWSMRENMSVRAAYGRTLVRPSMRELAPYKTESFSGGETFKGNAELQRSLIDNVDLRWEWFPKPGELLAVSAYYKVIHNPIELTFFPGANDIRYPENTSDDATILGAELEVRKQLDMWRWSRFFRVSGNLTLAYSRVELDSAMERNAEYFPWEGNTRPFQGQSPIVVNTFLTYDHPDIGVNASLYYNVFGERLAELTEARMPWIWQRPQHLLNFTASKTIGKHVTVKWKMANILNSSKKYVHYYPEGKYQDVVEDNALLVREEKSGRSYSLGVKVVF